LECNTIEEDAMLHFLVLFCFLIVPFVLPASAGSSQTEIRCASKDGKISLVGTVPPDDDLSIDLQLRNGQRRFHLLSENENSTRTMRVVENWSAGVYVLIVDGTPANDAYLTLYALPKTVRLKRIHNGIDATWDGILRLGGDVIAPEYLPDIFVRCSTHYAI
jgi:hypothetical protein